MPTTSSTLNNQTENDLNGSIDAKSISSSLSKNNVNSRPVNEVNNKNDKDKKYAIFNNVFADDEA